MIKPTYCLCQNCLKIYPYSDDRHSEKELCSCGGQLCGCPSCDEQAQNLYTKKLVKNGDEITPVFTKLRETKNG